MTENETKLINLIRNNPDPAKAFVTALEIILLFLEQETSESA